MDIKRITDAVSVSAQISPEDMGAIMAAGFRAIICNRPDGEGPDQPCFSEIEAAAIEAGLEASYVPIVTGRVADGDLEAFETALRELPRPVLAYCRSGTRAATMWALQEAGKSDLSAILAATRAAGFDVSGVARRLR